MGKIACLFPGQGSQYVGMGKDFYQSLPIARELFAQIDTIAGYKLSQMCFEGPESDLKRTIYTQPTILAASMVSWQAYRQALGPEPDYVAGHSLGEFTALYASGAITLNTAVKLVLARAALMNSCAAGAMSAVIGLSPEVLEKICSTVSGGSPKNADVVIVANFNTREQMVLSGNPQAVATASELAREQGGKVIALPVGGAFHSPLMVPASQEFKVTLAQFDFVGAKIPVVQNVDAQDELAADVLKDKVSRQMANPVRWLDTIEFLLAKGVDTFIEIGPGKALTGMVKKINRSAKTYNVADLPSLSLTLEALKQAPVSL